jgi:hypothetical protein
MMFSVTFPHIVERSARKLVTRLIEIVAGVRHTVSKNAGHKMEVIKAEAKLGQLFQLLGEFSERG